MTTRECEDLATRAAGKVAVGLDVGEYLVFDGANRLHGTMSNEEGYTRVSFDFRLLPRQLANSDQQTVSAGRSRRVGDYYLV